MDVTSAEREASEVLHTLLAVERVETIQKCSTLKNNRDRVKEESLEETNLDVISDIPEINDYQAQTCLDTPQDVSLRERTETNSSDVKIIDSVIENTEVTDVNELERELTCNNVEGESKVRGRKKLVTNLKLKKNKIYNESNYDPTKLEDSPAQIVERFERGCECQDDQCFRGLNPEAVYRHRLNIADLTKAEHDMYLMGVTMACLTNPYETARHTERRRLRAQYVYQGRRVCLDAFLYLENCTHYQIKRIRKHLITHGVTPRVHGNHGKVPHNTFSLDIYKIATEFLKSFIKKQEVRQKTKGTKNAPLHLPPDITRKTVHDLYSKYSKKMSPSIKLMGYSTFRRFMKVQFPQVKFAKLEFAVRTQNAQNQNSVTISSEKQNDRSIESTQLMTENSELVPLVIANGAMEQSGTYFLTPVNKLQEGVSYQLTSGGLLVNRTTLPLTVANINSV